MTQLTNGAHRKRVKSVEENKRSYSGAKGTIYIHMVTFDDGSVGEHHSTKQSSEYFRVGLEVDFECEIQQKNNYTNYKIKPKKDNNSFGKGGNFGNNSIEAAKWTAAAQSLDMAIKLAIAGKIELGKLVDQAKRNYSIISEIVSGDKPDNTNQQ